MWRQVWMHTCQMLSYTCWCITNTHKKQHVHTCVCTHTHSISTSCRLTHLPSQEAMGPVGQSKLESLVHLFTSNYRNRAISATTTPAFFFFHILEWEREGGREGERQLGSRNKRKVWERDEERERRKREKKQSLDSLFSQWWAVISSPQHCYSLQCLSTVQQDREGESVLYCKPSHPHVTWMCKFMRNKQQQNKAIAVFCFFFLSFLPFIH